MKRLFIMVGLAAMLGGCIERVENKPSVIDNKKAVAACEQIVTDYQAALKRELMTAMTEGGPEKAIAVCNIVAPALADSFSSLPGVDIRRVSLKQRNPQFAPDGFESIVLGLFAAAPEAEPQTHTELVTDSSGVKKLRYMQEIKIGQLCLKCHGDPNGFSENLKAALAENYPEDKAVGYNLGESRGAFSVTLTFPEAQKAVTAILSENGR